MSRSFARTTHVRLASAVLGLAILASPLPAQPRASGVPPVLAPVPFRVGEELTYKATFGGIPAGSARMHVAGIELVHHPRAAGT